MRSIWLLDRVFFLLLDSTVTGDWLFPHNIQRLNWDLLFLSWLDLPWQGCFLAGCGILIKVT